MKNLVSFGCSWTSGYGLLSPETDAFPALIAKNYNLNLENLAEPGSSLMSMQWTLNNWLNSHTLEYIQNSVLLVGLTLSVRHSWFNANYEVYTHPTGPTYTGYKYIDSTMVDELDAKWQDMHKQHYLLSDCKEYRTMIYETTVRQFASVAEKYGSTVIQFTMDKTVQEPVPHCRQPLPIGHTMFTLEDNPLKSNLFQNDFHPNEAGHIYISHLIEKELNIINSDF